jgi:two-component system sensor histidine kinase KdpD
MELRLDRIVGPAAGGRNSAGGRDSRLQAYLLALVGVAAALATALVLRPWLPLANLSLVFLVALLWLAVRTGPRPALFAALLSALAYNYFLTEPYHSLVIQHTDELVTVVFFLIVSLFGGRIAERLRRQLLALQAANDQARLLLDLSERLSGLTDLGEVQKETRAVLAAQSGRDVVLFALSDDGKLAPVSGAERTPAPDAALLAAAYRACGQRRADGPVRCGGALEQWQLWPLGAEQDCLGVIALREISPATTLTAQPVATEALIAHAALAMVRTRLADRLRRARIGEETERLRAALLSSISHDLRTPLAAIIGAASGLRTLDRQISATDREELLDTILGEGARLDRYIQNLLDMTRLGHGGLKLERDWVGVDDLFGVVLSRLREPLRAHRVSLDAAPDMPLLYVHPALIEQALINVVENAAKFSPEGTTIRLAASLSGPDLMLSVVDQGPGIVAAERERVLDMFYTTAAGDRGGQGTGLGLAIADGMITAHGGRIEITDGPGGRGTACTIYLPLMDISAASESDT